MEHSLLHALQLIGLVVAGGSLWFGLLAVRAGLHREDQRAGCLLRKWAGRASWAASGAAFADLFVQLAEIEGQTVFGGVSLSQLYAFIETTTVGQLGFARSVLLFVLGLVFRSSHLASQIFALPLYLTSAVLAASVSHAAAQPVGTMTAVSVHLVHLLALSAWIGSVFHVWLQRNLWLEPSSAAAAGAWLALLKRFSPVALLGSVCVFGSGLSSALQYIRSPWDLLFSAYGLTLLLKLLLVAVVVAGGAFNFLYAVPALQRSSEPFSGIRWRLGADRFRRSLELEATAGILAIAVAGIVGSVSPPGGDGAVTLSPRQVDALLIPKLPQRSFIDPQLFVGDSERNQFDLLYSEFMHNWSGVGVFLMGCFWLLQGGQGRAAEIATRLWPIVFVPFALFISLFADPEVFLLRRVTVREALSDPVVLEHQIGALLVLVFVWLGWRDRHRGPLERPLGPFLPLLMILGSLLLLGHAHASVRATQELTNLINVQHAVFGTLGLLAGMIRWFMLRGLLPATPARFVWPLLVMILGILMTFFYREAI